VRCAATLAAQPPVSTGDGQHRIDGAGPRIRWSVFSLPRKWPMRSMTIVHAGRFQPTQLAQLMGSLFPADTSADARQTATQRKPARHRFGEPVAFHPRVPCG